MSPGAFGQLPGDLKMRAFTVSRIEDVRVLEGIRETVARLPEGGDWRKLREEVARQIAGDAEADKGHRARAELVMRMNGMAAYAAARHADQVASADIFPYWMYMCNLDGRERDSHARLNGLVLRYDDPFWKNHYPPWEWGCRCYVTKITAAEAEDYGVADSGAVSAPPSDSFHFNPSSLAINVKDLIGSLANASDRAFAEKLFKVTEVPMEEGFTQTVMDFNDAPPPTPAETQAHTPDQVPTPLAAAITKVRGEIKRLKTERFVLLDGEGREVVKRHTSGRTGGAIPRDMMEKAKGNTFVHNHPSAVWRASGIGNSFSPEDIQAAINLDVRSIVAVAGKRTYEMAAGPSGWPAKIDVFTKAAAEYRKVKDLLEQRVRNGRITQDEYGNIRDHLIWKRVAKQTGMVYSVQRHKEEK